MEEETGMNDMIPMCLIIQGEMFFFLSPLLHNKLEIQAIIYKQLWTKGIQQLISSESNIFCKFEVSFPFFLVLVTNIADN